MTYPSFGFIDDGSDRYSTIERRGTIIPWAIEYEQDF